MLFQSCVSGERYACSLNIAFFHAARIAIYFDPAGTSVASFIET